jgi:aspartate racemase
MRPVGIVGGMGPGATLDLFQKIIDQTPAKSDQDHIHLQIDCYPQIPDRTTFLVGDGENPLPYLLESAKRLESAGVQALCMPCNTAHYFIEDIRRQINIPFISIIEATVAKIKKMYPDAKQIGLLATRGTFEASIYHRVLNAVGLDVLPLSEEFKNQMMDVIYTVKAGQLTEKLYLFNSCLRQLQDAGAEVMIAGCTEIPLLLPYIDSQIPFVDPTQALAEEVVAFALKDTLSAVL